jgi:rhamnulokinase
VSVPLHIAIDLGAGSGRVFLAGVAPGEMMLQEIRRFQYPPSIQDGHLRWNLSHIFEEIKAGLREAVEQARANGRHVESIGVDSWGVDYGLINAEGEIVEDPVCYRDKRTSGQMEQVFERIAREKIFTRTGIQFLNFNTLFQLKAQMGEGLPAGAARLLMIPDLINFLLTGKAVTEYTNATTTQLVNAETREWDTWIIECLGLPAHLLSAIVPAGTDLGPIRPQLARELNLDGARIISPATHDTASAVAGTPLRDGWAYISSGTWSLVGVELRGTLINSEVEKHNFTNEGGAFGTVRFLKNIMGLWVLESCRRDWRQRGLAVDHDALLARVEGLEGFHPWINVDDERLFNPPSMLGAIEEQLSESGRVMNEDPATIAKIVLDSLALKYASVISKIETLTGSSIEGIRIVGGGSKNRYLNEATAKATGKPVVAGPVEATVIGNVLVQAIALGHFANLAAAREYVSEQAGT